MKSKLSLAFFVLLFAACLFIAGEAFADGEVTGYYYDPRVGRVVPRVDNYSPKDSEAYLAGNTDIESDEGDVESEADAEDSEGEAKGKDKDKDNNGVGWGVGGNPELKIESDGDLKKNAYKHQ